MSDGEVATALIGILREKVGIEGPVTPESHLVTDLALDSLALLTLVVSAEDRFRVVFKEEEAADIRTIRDLARHIVRLMEQPC